MATIEDQIELEKRMVAFGVSRYKHSVTAAESNERSADTQYAQKLMQEFVTPVAEGIEEYTSTKRPGVAGKYRALLRKVDPDTAAFIGLRSMFNNLLKNPKAISVAANIGLMIEDELKFSIFRAEEPDYYTTILNDFKRKGTKNYRHMHRVLTMKANEKEISWNSWSQEERVGVGMKILDLIMANTDLIQKDKIILNRKEQVFITPTPEALEWIRKYNEFAQMLHPDRMPCVIPPDEWTDLHNGGFFTAQMRKRSPLVKTKHPDHRKMFNGDISRITEAVNHLQNTPWKVNTKLFNVLKLAWDMSLPLGLPKSEPYIIPTSPVEGKKKEDFTPAEQEAFEMWKEEARAIHTMERERVSKCFEIVRLVRLAQEYREYDKFWFVYQCDFRGRMYCTTSGLSPQGTDPAKACLLFAEGKRLTHKGSYWLRVHGANCYGVDKVPFDDRVRWIDMNREEILACAVDPISNTSFWGNADSPWQFLAFCFEYQRFIQEGPNMISYLPIGMDGSCNGLQHFSAMLRDSVGGKATNLVPADSPADIYAEVAKVCYGKLRRGTGDMAGPVRDWLKEQGTVPRGLAKKPVMTLPYGSTQQSCKDSVYAYLREYEATRWDTRDMFRISVYMTGPLWESISEVVVAARSAMDWVQDCASILAKHNKAIVWWTPIGFPVHQYRPKYSIRRIDTELCGRLTVMVGTETNKMDVLRNRQASSPNFIHSMDACHAMLTLLRGADFGLTSFAFIHDDFGTHAADIDDLHQAIRETFVEMYSENDPITDFKLINSHAGIDLPEPPVSGDLNLGQVIDSEYFFS